MKRAIYILTFLSMIICSVVSGQDLQTEEYAILDVFEFGKSKTIRITIGEADHTVIEWKTERGNNTGNFSEVIKQLIILNKQGFELLNMTTTYSTHDGGSFGESGTPRFTFMLVKKIE
ncbi:MAG: hypothetical protein ACJAXX_001437 [Roseivirga sp.]|jgi:hypothetical protein